MISKRQLGFGILISGFLIGLALFVKDFVGLAEYAGIGPLERNLYIAAIILILLGLSLIPFGNKPA